MGMRIRHGVSANPLQLGSVWPSILMSAASASDRSRLKRHALCISVSSVVAAGALAVPARRLRMSPVLTCALGSAIALPVCMLTDQVFARRAVSRADDIVVDALARSNLDGPLGVYLARTMDNNVVLTLPYQIVPSPTGAERFDRMRARLDRKWGLSAYQLVAKVTDSVFD